jgi:hypothetical protein
MNSIKTSRGFGAGAYYVTGHIAGRLIQYSLFKTDKGWELTRVYGQGVEFYAPFDTKRAAINTLLSVQA